MAKGGRKKVKPTSDRPPVSKEPAKKKAPRKSPEPTAPEAPTPPRSSEDSSYSLPHDGELHRAGNRISDMTIVFIHHYGGSKRTLLRHVRLVNTLGYDAVVFSMWMPPKGPFRLPLTNEKKFGVRHVWAEQIGRVLDAVPGRKVVFSLSMPTNSAVEAIAKRRAEDVDALICDGGPFLQLITCTSNLYKEVYGITSPILRAMVGTFALGVYGPGLERELPNTFARLPENFPVLSIRGEDDPLVPVEAIDEFFSHQAHLVIARLQIAGGGHLDGIKKSPDRYLSAVRDFLASL